MKTNNKMGEYNKDMKVINNYQECYDIINENNDIQFMFVNEKFCAGIGLNKENIDEPNICVFKANDELFLFFKDKQKIMKVFSINKYYKISINIENLSDVPKNILDDLVTLYNETNEIYNLLNGDIKEHTFNNYYLVNKNWLNKYKEYYNYTELVKKHENKGYQNNNQNLKNKKNKKKNKNKKDELNIQYANVQFPEFLLNENNILPNNNIFKSFPYFTEFELIEINIFHNLCKHLKINISSQILDKISYKALLGNNKIILQRESKNRGFAVFSTTNNETIIDYLIIFNDNNIIDNEIEKIKNKGIDNYLLEKNINFNDDNLQYLIDLNDCSMIGNIHVINKKQINNNNSNVNNNLNNNINSNINNYQYTNLQIKQMRPYRLGLDNIGATCYMNATLQCLCNIVQLQNYFLNNNEVFQKPGATLSKAFSDVLQNLYDNNNNKNSYSPYNFKNTISEMNSLFKGVAANDSKDLILFLYEKIHEELNIQNNYNNLEQNIPYELQLFRQNYYSNNSSIIEKTFYNEVQTINECTKCGNKKINYEIQNILIFPLEKIRQDLIFKYKDGFNCVHLEDCFEQISLPELLQGPNSIYCNNCNQNTIGKYYNKLNTSPEIITINLNRGKGNEFDVEFDFPLRIDLKNYVNMNNKCTIYDLIGVIVHIGGSNMSGHFFSFCKSNIDNNWYKYNDSIVEKCDDKYGYVIKNTGLPYVLFYQNIGCLNNMNNDNQTFSLYFKTIYGKEIYIDVNNNDYFSNIIQKISIKCNSCNFDYMKANYFIMNQYGKQYIDNNKTIKENNLTKYSCINIE